MEISKLQNKKIQLINFSSLVKNWLKSYIKSIYKTKAKKLCIIISWNLNKIVF